MLVLPHNLMPHIELPGWAGRGLMAALDRGWVGVQLFFVLSGFLITGILLDTRRWRHALPVFFARRMLRIFPLYYLTLWVMLVLLPAVPWPPNQPTTPAPLAWSYGLYLTNWVAPWFEGKGVLPHLWSLAVEEQFYLVWPFVVWHLRPRSVIALALGVAIVALLTRLWMLSRGWPEAAVYQFTLCRIDALVLGSAAAAAWREPSLMPVFSRIRRAGWLALAVGVAGALVSHAYLPYGPGAQTVGYLMLSMAFALWLLSVAGGDLQSQTLPGHGWLRSRWLQGWGRYSYAMYVLHVPLAVAVGRPLLAVLQDNPHLTRTTPLPAGVGLLYAVGMMALTYGAAWCSYHGFERHFLQRKPHYAEAPAAGA